MAPLRTCTRNPVLLLSALLLVAASSACRSVPFHERERLATSIMALEESPGEIHFCQKVFYSMEGSAGGLGAGAGGGCGCY